MIRPDHPLQDRKIDEVEVIEGESIIVETGSSRLLHGLGVLGGTLLASFVDTLLDRTQSRQSTYPMSTSAKATVENLNADPDYRLDADSGVGRGGGRRQRRRMYRRAGSGRRGK